jgi:hypothetical protein
MGVTSIIVGLGLVFAPESARTVRPVVVEPAVDGAVDCAPVALAELGLAWRPHGSRVSLFAAVAVASLAALRQSVGMQVVGGLRIDLPRWLGGNVPGARR